jgi:hypothetical protein
MRIAGKDIAPQSHEMRGSVPCGVGPCVRIQTCLWSSSRLRCLQVRDCKHEIDCGVRPFQMTCDQCRTCRISRDLDFSVLREAERRPLWRKAADALLNFDFRPNGQLPVWEMDDIHDSIADAPHTLASQAGLIWHWMQESAGCSLAIHFAVVVCHVAPRDDTRVSLLTLSEGLQGRSASSRLPDPTQYRAGS